MFNSNCSQGSVIKKWFCQNCKMCNIEPYPPSWRWYGLSKLNNFTENILPHRRSLCKKIKHLVTDLLILIHDSQTEFNSVAERTLLILFDISPFYKSHCFSIWWIQCLTRERFHRKSIFCNIIMFLYRTIKHWKNFSYYHWFDYGMLYNLDFLVCQLISFTNY